MLSSLNSSCFKFIPKSKFVSPFKSPNSQHSKFLYSFTPYSRKMSSSTSPIRHPLWLVADMDETLLAKKCRDIREAPTYNSLIKWLHPSTGLNNKLLIVTSDDGFRPFRIWSQLPDEVKPNVLLSTAEGAWLWRWKLKEVDDVSSTAANSTEASEETKIVEKDLSVKTYVQNDDAGSQAANLKDSTNLKNNTEELVTIDWVKRYLDEQEAERKADPIKYAAENKFEPEAFPDYHGLEISDKKEVLNLARKLFVEYALNADTSKIEDETVRKIYEELRSDEYKNGENGDYLNLYKTTCSEETDFKEMYGPSNYFLTKQKVVWQSPIVWINQGGDVKKWSPQPLHESARWSNVFVMGVPQPENFAVVEKIKKEMENYKISISASSNLALSAAPRSI